MIRRGLAAGAVSILFLALCLHVVDVRTFASALASAEPYQLAIVVALSVVMAVLRAARLTVAIRSVPAPVVFKASFLHGAANAVLPARTGEAVLPLTLARYGKVDAAHGAGLLLLVRLCDLTALAGGGLILCGIVYRARLSPPVTVAAAVGGLGLLAVIPVLPSLVGRLTLLAPGSWRGIVSRIAGAGAHMRGADRLALFGLTAAIWLTLGIAGQVAASAVGLGAGLAPVWLACVGASLAFAMPANGFASFGPFEAAFVGILAGDGHSVPAALAAALCLHAGALIAAGATAAAATCLPAPPAPALCR